MEHNLCIGHAIRNIRMLTDTYIKLLEANADAVDKDNLIVIIKQLDARLKEIQDAIDSHMAEL